MSGYYPYQTQLPQNNNNNNLLQINNADLTYWWINEQISTCKDRLFCSFLFWIAVLLGIFILLFLLNIIARVILSIINCVVISALHICDKCCVARLAPIEEECTAELIELRTRTLSWGKNAEAKIGALRKDYEELKKRSGKISSTIHWPGV